MCPRHIRSILSLAIRRTNPPRHLSYHWQRPAGKRDKPLGAGIVDAEAWERAWDAAMPADSFTTTNKEA